MYTYNHACISDVALLSSCAFEAVHRQTLAFSFSQSLRTCRLYSNDVMGFIGGELLVTSDPDWVAYYTKQDEGECATNLFI